LELRNTCALRKYLDINTYILISCYTYKKEKDICLVGIKCGPLYLFKVVAKCIVVANDVECVL
jgi:hypothetical protein